jgi:hypothetical protein
MGSAPPGWSPKHERRGPGPRSHLVAAEGRAGPGGRLAEAGSVRGARPRGSTEWRRARVARGSQEVAVARRTSATRARVARTEVAGRAEVGQRWQVAARRPLAPALEPERGGGENGEKGSKTYRTTPVNGRRGTGLGELCFEGRNGGGIHFGGGILRGAGHPPWSGQAEGRRRPPAPTGPHHAPHQDWKESNPSAFKTGIEGLPRTSLACLNGTDSASALDGFQALRLGSSGMPSSPPQAGA